MITISPKEEEQHRFVAAFRSNKIAIIFSYSHLTSLSRARDYFDVFFSVFVFVFVFTAIQWRSRNVLLKSSSAPLLTLKSINLNFLKSERKEESAVSKRLWKLCSCLQCLSPLLQKHTRHLTPLHCTVLYCTVPHSPLITLYHIHH